MTLRVFDKVRGGDLESHSIIVSKGQEKPEQWQYVLSQKTNNASGIVRLGKLGADGRSCRSRLPTATKSTAEQGLQLRRRPARSGARRSPTGIVPPTAS